MAEAKKPVGQPPSPDRKNHLPRVKVRQSIQDAMLEIQNATPGVPLSAHYETALLNYVTTHLPRVKSGFVSL